MAAAEQLQMRLRTLDEEISRAEQELQQLVETEGAGLAEIGQLLARLRALRSGRESISRSLSGVDA